MAYRLNSRFHDWVIEKTVEEFYRSKIVYTNPNQQKNTNIEGLYPDIIVCGEDGSVKIIDEIETSESVTESEAEQWKNFSKLNVNHFSLTVPYEKVNELLVLLNKHSISVTSIWAYNVSYGNTIKFTKVRG